MSLNEKIHGHGPKKILALDGGGIRGMITVEVLARLEDVLRKKTGADADFVLADYFDYISGTSTGAIIATALSLGWSVKKISDFYIDSGAQMFDKASFLKKLKYSYEDKQLKKTLQREFGVKTTLGSRQLKTLLMIVMRNSTTDSPWPISNNPRAMFNSKDKKDNNLDLPLWQLVRASTAAPTYFPPEKVQVGNNHFVFVDGGITMYNNPAFQTFMMATLGPYNLGWETGEDKLLIVSLGTGTSPDANKNLGPSDMNLLYNAKSLPSALMLGALNEQDLLCRAFGNCLCGDELDMELGDLIDPAGELRRPVNSPLFTYVRYNAQLTREGLDRLGLKSTDPQKVQKLDAVANIPDLQRIGKAVSKKVKAEHFKRFV